jgi:hypothetical protein
MTSNVPQRQPIRDRHHLAALAMIAVFDIAGPLLTYSLMRNAGQGAVPALIFSGIFPAVGVVLGFARHRQVDAVGILVLAGVAVGTVLGLVSGSARLMLAEGSVPTAIFGLACIGSLWTSRPLIFRFALEFIGADTPKGRDFTALWRYAEFRRIFRLFTVVWGVGYLTEAAVRVIIIEMAPVGTALLVSRVMPYAVAVLLIIWTRAYADRARRRGERLIAAPPSAEPHRTPELQEVSA